MYTTCAFCNAKLDGDGGPSGLGVGRRIAFDEWRGRLWVICPKCARWNLTPLDDRLERIETVARAAREAKLLAATEQVALLRWQVYDLVRVGKPPRIELAPWRYGERLRARRQERLKYVIPLTVAAVGLGVAANVAAGGSLGVFVWNLHRLADGLYVTIVGNRKVNLVEPPICAHCGRRPERRLALEMAVDEQAEVQELEREWRDAEELADIADGTLSSNAQIEEELRRLKGRGGNQPNG